MNQSQKLSLLNWMPLPDVQNVSGTCNKCMNLPTDDSKTTYANRRYCGDITSLPTALPIWSGPDKKAEKYYPISPYTYCAGNPIKFIDPSGMKLVISNTSFEDFCQIYSSLMKLSDDDLKFNVTDEGYEIQIESKNDKTKPAGTNLVRNVIELNKTVTVTTEHFTENEISCDSKEDSVNDIGTDATIILEKINNVKVGVADNITNEFRFEGRPEFIGFAHELIHSLHFSLGEGLNEKKYKFTTYVGESRIESWINDEEKRTIGLGCNFNGDITENNIRAEHGLNLRVIYNGM